MEIDGKSVPTSPLSSFAMAKRIAAELKRRIESGGFSLTSPVQTLPLKARVGTLEDRPVELGKAPQAPKRAGNGRKKSIVRDENRCIHCGHCLSLCPRGAISKNGDWTIVFHSGLCSACGVCADACPLGALALSGE
jgi:ferredoxin